MNSTACLQLDVGNSSAKWRLVCADEVVARGHYHHEDAALRETLLNSCDTVAQIWIASVAGAVREAQISELLTHRWGVQPWFARTPPRTGDLINSYEQPGRMGVDRWLVMLAARARCSGRSCVVDCGSALTIDLVAADGRHEGGFIIPGPELMERALLLDTDRVRFDEIPRYALQPGVSTAEAVYHGTALAQVGAVALALDRAVGEPPELLFTGGGGHMVQALLDRGGEWVEDLVFEGLELMAAEVH
ncbi:MAG: type III pantothenate kinase [Pseudomonadota bacterium]